MAINQPLPDGPLRSPSPDAPLSPSMHARLSASPRLHPLRLDTSAAKLDKIPEAPSELGSPVQDLLRALGSSTPEPEPELERALTDSAGLDGGNIPKPTFLSKLVTWMRANPHSKTLYWSASGEFIIIPDEQALITDVIRVLFAQRDFASFSRQLNLYGWVRANSTMARECADAPPNARVWRHQFLTRASPFEDVFKVKRRAGQKRQSTMPAEADASHFKRARSASAPGEAAPVSHLMRSHGPPAGPVTRAIAPLPRPAEAGAVAFSNLPSSVDTAILLQMIADARLPKPDLLDCRPTSDSSAAAIAHFSRLSDAATVASALNGRVIDGVEMHVTYQPRALGPQPSFAPQPVPYAAAPAPYRPYMPTPGPSHASPASYQPRAPSGSGTAPDDASMAIDWNDERTLAVRDRLIQFRDDGLRDEMPFTRALSSERRRIVRLIAQRLSLHHRTIGEDPYRQVVVYKALSA